MSSNDYTATTGGTLKLKGAIPKSSKTHKKKRLKPALPSSSNPSVLVQGGSTWKEVENQDKCLGEEAANKEERLAADKEEKNEEEQVVMPRLGKTDAEIRHEDRRRRKVAIITTFLSTSLHFTPLLWLYFQIQLTHHINTLFPPTIEESIANQDQYFTHVATRTPQTRRHQNPQRACRGAKPLPQQPE